MRIEKAATSLNDEKQQTINLSWRQTISDHHVSINYSGRYKFLKKHDDFRKKIVYQAFFSLISQPENV